ncbi:hypothetical protein Tco_1453215, partial [Tanacetum coccineum]
DHHVNMIIASEDGDEIVIRVYDVQYNEITSKLRRVFNNRDKMKFGFIATKISLSSPLKLMIIKLYTRRSRVVAVFIRHPVLNHSRSETENQIIRYASMVGVDGSWFEAVFSPTTVDGRSKIGGINSKGDKRGSQCDT